MKYLIFLEKNREKIKSKLIRRYLDYYLDQIPSLEKCRFLSKAKAPYNVAATIRNMKTNTNTLIES